jgi:uncharacterized protein (TIGR03382 family)
MVLVVVACIGFVTVADDLDHKGELFGVSGILVAGLVLLVAGSRRRRGLRGQSKVGP